MTITHTKGGHAAVRLFQNRVRYNKRAEHTKTIYKTALLHLTLLLYRPYLSKDITVTVLFLESEHEMVMLAYLWMMAATRYLGG